MDSDLKKNLQTIENGDLKDNGSIKSSNLNQNGIDQVDEPQSYNCNINYTNESNNNNINDTTIHLNQNNKNDLAIIDVIKTAHTTTDQCKITTKSTKQPTPHTQTHLQENRNNVAYDVNGNTAATIHPDNHNDDTVDRNKQKLSTKIVVLLRRSKPIALVVINSVLAVLIAISVCITMGLDYTIPAIIFGLIAIVASSGLWYWLYIAAVTAPRDVR